jgi:regulation of enolase protein 1 (concanavalin A-like superfamily)
MWQASRMEFTLPAVPLTFQWVVPPTECGLNDGVLSAAAPPTTDVFVDPAGDAATTNAPRALAPSPGGDWRLSARVRVGFRGTFDAGALVIWFDETRWAKLCFEISPAGIPGVVSVVCDGLADDANAWPVTGDARDGVWLRVTRRGNAFAFHAGSDGRTWEFIRHFALGAGETPSIGFLVQAPTGSGCTAIFDHVEYAASAPADLRDGS